MTTTPNDQHKQNLLEAARKLREHQLAWIRAAQNITALKPKKTLAEHDLEDSELELAEADAAFAASRLKVLRLIREIKRIDIIATDLYLNKGNPRNDLWRSCATGSDDEIVAASCKLAEHDIALWDIQQLLDNRRTDLRAAHEELAVHSAARRAAVQKRGRAKAALQTATDELRAAHRQQPFESTSFYDLELNVVQAAAEMNGYAARQFGISFVETKDLGITGPGLEVPIEAQSIEEMVRYREGGGFGTKPVPSREEE